MNKVRNPNATCDNCSESYYSRPSSNATNKTCSRECRKQLFMKNKIKTIEQKIGVVNLKKFLTDKYLYEKMTIRQIAVILGYSNASTEVVSNILKFYDIPIRYGSEAVATQWINNESRKQQASKIAKTVFLDPSIRENIKKIQQTDEYRNKISIANTGEKNGQWKGGITPLIVFLREREHLNEWKIKSINHCEYKCVISGDRFDDIHHLYAFNLILEEALELTKIPLKSKINEYSTNELELLVSAVRELHKKYPLGVCLRRDIHILFHQQYGYKNNTPEQFYDFKERFHSGEINPHLRQVENT